MRISRKGIEYRVVYDPTVFIEESVRAVIHTIFEAALLVVVVVMVFLQSWRASIIPILAIPVSLIGTFAVMAALGFSLNNLSLFGLVLAIGIVVDDAIVVVENVERNLAEGLAPREATIKAMEEVGRRAHRHRARAQRSFHPDGLHQRNLGSVLPAVCAHHRSGDALFRLRLADAQPCALRRFASTAWREEGLVRADVGLHTRLVFSPFQSQLRGSFTRYGRLVSVVTRRTAIVLILYVGLLALTVVRFHQSARRIHPRPRIKATSSQSRNCRRALRFPEPIRWFAGSPRSPGRSKA